MRVYGSAFGENDININKRMSAFCHENKMHLIFWYSKTDQLDSALNNEEQSGRDLIRSVFKILGFFFNCQIGRLEMLTKNLERP